MKVADGCLLSYCMNVHPGERLEQVETALEQHVSVVGHLVTGGEEFGASLWLAEKVTDQLISDPGRLITIKAQLRDWKLRAFSVNAFPIGGFHEARVKRKVYRPTWLGRRRLDYTIKVARLLCALLPEGQAGIISTVPLSFKPFQEEDHLPLMLKYLIEIVLTFQKLEAVTGHELVLCLEPEPQGLLETTPETIEFFKTQLIPNGIELMQERCRLSAKRCEELIRRHLGVCFDTCHLACEWEDIRRSVIDFKNAGIRIGKTQISVALELRQPGQNPEGVTRLRSFNEPRYLHQSIARAGLQAEDIPELFDTRGQLLPEWAEVEALRTHFHVPIFWRGDECLRTTRDSLNGVIPELIDAGCRHFEVETYSWNVLPKEIRKTISMQGNLNGNLVREIEEALTLFP